MCLTSVHVTFSLNVEEGDIAFAWFGQAVRTSRRIGSLPFSEFEQSIRLLIRDSSVCYRLAGSRISEQCKEFSPLGPLLRRLRKTTRATAVDLEQSRRSIEKASAISW